VTHGITPFLRVAAAQGQYIRGARPSPERTAGLRGGGAHRDDRDLLARLRIVCRSWFCTVEA
jgi:hypothetical protein